jgi:hypothetical protein
MLVIAPIGRQPLIIEAATSRLFVYGPPLRALRHAWLYSCRRSVSTKQAFTDPTMVFTLTLPEFTNLHDFFCSSKVRRALRKATVKNRAAAKIEPGFGPGSVTRESLLQASGFGGEKDDAEPEDAEVGEGLGGYRFSFQPRASRKSPIATFHCV